MHRAHGRLLNSVRRDILLQPHLLGTWPSSRGVTHGVISILRSVLKGCTWGCFEFVICVCGHLLVVACACAAAACCFMKVFAGGVLFDTVDLYNSVSGTWSTARLSVARTDFAAASVGNVAIFAGGNSWAGNSILCPFFDGCSWGSRLWLSCV